MVVALVADQIIGLCLLFFVLGCITADLSRPGRRRGKRREERGD